MGLACLLACKLSLLVVVRIWWAWPRVEFHSVFLSHSLSLSLPVSQSLIFSLSSWWYRILHWEWMNIVLKVGKIGKVRDIWLVCVSLSLMKLFTLPFIFLLFLIFSGSSYVPYSFKSFAFYAFFFPLCSAFMLNFLFCLSPFRLNFALQVLENSNSTAIGSPLFSLLVNILTSLMPTS